MHPSGVVSAALIAAVLPLSFALPLQAPQNPTLSLSKRNLFPGFGKWNVIGSVDIGAVAGFVKAYPTGVPVPTLSYPAPDPTPTPSSGESPIAPESVVGERDSTFSLSKRINFLPWFGNWGVVDNLSVHDAPTISDSAPDPTPTPDSGELPTDETSGSVVHERDFFHKILSGSLSIAHDETRRDGTGGIDQPGAGTEGGGGGTLGQAPNGDPTNADPSQGRGGNGGGPKLS